MRGNVSRKDPADRRWVNIGEAWEIHYWCTHFRVTENQLREAIKTVGVMANHVGAYLDGRNKAKPYRQDRINR
jgi:hypothetical protein